MVGITINDGKIIKSRKKKEVIKPWGRSGEKVFKPSSTNGSNNDNGKSRKSKGQKKCCEGLDCHVFKNHQYDPSYCQHFMEFYHEDDTNESKTIKKNNSNVFNKSGRTLAQSSKIKTTSSKTTSSKKTAINSNKQNKTNKSAIIDLT